MRRNVLIALILLGLVGPATAADGAARYPAQPVRIVVPLTPGTTIDILARIFYDKLGPKLNGSFVVLNRPGAGGLIAAQTVASSAADGYTLLFANSGHTILGTLNKNLPFDPVKDFKGVALVGDTPAVVAVSPSLHVNTLKEFVELIKKNPGKFNYGSAGIGTATHLAGAYFCLKAGIDMIHVPYKDSTQILTDMAAGRLQAVFAPAAYLRGMVAAGKIKVLAVGDKAPLVEPFAAPTAISQGVDYINSTWYGFLAPASVPRPILQKLSSAIIDISKDPDVIARIKTQGITPRRIGLGKFDSYIATDMNRLAPLLQKISIEATH